MPCLFVFSWLPSYSCGVPTSNQKSWLRLLCLLRILSWHGLIASWFPTFVVWLFVIFWCVRNWLVLVSQLIRDSTCFVHRLTQPSKNGRKFIGKAVTHQLNTNWVLPDLMVHHFPERIICGIPIFWVKLKQEYPSIVTIGFPTKNISKWPSIVQELCSWGPSWATGWPQKSVYHRSLGSGMTIVDVTMSAPSKSVKTCHNIFKHLETSKTCCSVHPGTLLFTPK